jgi:Bacteriophage T4-like portal protein (Gp20)
MSWQKHLRTVKLQQPQPQKDTSVASVVNTDGNFHQYYKGHPNRFQRYRQYDDMDRDSIVNTALDIISDFCTQSEQHTIETFFVNFDASMPDGEIKIINRLLKQWTKLNNFTNRLWNIFRDVIQKGDEVFIVHPETLEWLWIDPYCVEQCEFDPSEHNKITYYHIRGLSPVMAAKVGAISQQQSGSYGYGSSVGNVSTVAKQFQLADIATAAYGSAGTDNTIYRVDAKFIVHLTTNNGMDSMWPFGKSMLESVYQTYKQKQLIEDAVIIYRVQYAPVRRVFNIDVGNMKPVEANAYIERYKNENHQKRTMGKNGSLIDAAYNPLSMMEDYYFAKSAESRGSSVELLQGGDQVGEISDLSYWDKKLRDGIGIPSTYMPGVDAQGTYSDGKVGAAVVQEFLFNKQCLRIQNSLIDKFDIEFKKFLEHNGITVDQDGFSIKFNPPQNFQKYRQIALDTEQAAVYTQFAENTKMSERYKLKRYLGWTEEDIQENQRMWMEENPEKVKKATGSAPQSDSPGLEDVGINEDNLVREIRAKILKD